MAITIHVGKAVLVPFTVNMSDGGVNLTTAATAGTNDAKIRATVNPGNGRELAINGLSATSNATVTLSCGGQQTSLVVSAVAPVVSSVTLGMVGEEIDPPAWA